MAILTLSCIVNFQELCFVINKTQKKILIQTGIADTSYSELPGGNDQVYLNTSFLTLSFKDILRKGET